MDNVYVVAESAFGPVLDQLVDYTSNGTSVHLVGPRGSGRTSSLRLAADRLDDRGDSVLRLNGNPAWRNHAFGALSAAGIEPTQAPGSRPSAGAMLEAIVQHLRTQTVVV